MESLLAPNDSVFASAGSAADNKLPGQVGGSLWCVVIHVGAPARPG